MTVYYVTSIISFTEVYIQKLQTTISSPLHFLLCVCFIQDAEDPFYVVDLGRLIDLHHDWVSALPTVRPFYAVKCNEDPVLLKTLAALGTGFDCASKVC